MGGSNLKMRGYSLRLLGVRKVVFVPLRVLSLDRPTTGAFVVILEYENIT